MRYFPHIISLLYNERCRHLVALGQLVFKFVPLDVCSNARAGNLFSDSTPGIHVFDVRCRFSIRTFCRAVTTVVTEYAAYCASALPADDRFRSAFLWGRREMLAAVAARLRDRTDLVWVDLGGGTGVRSHYILK